MTINAQQFITQVAEPVLEGLVEAGVPYSATALNLCMGTIAQESLLGTFLVQEGGSALGIGQIEPTTLADLLSRIDGAQGKFLDGISTKETAERNVVTNLSYAFALVRLFYWLIPDPLPENTVSGLFAYYKQWYNTPLGATTLRQWRQNWLLTGINLPP